FFLHCLRAHRDLHSFPTRRSSDLGQMPELEAGAFARLFVTLLDGVVEAPGSANDGECSVALAVHLIEPARLEARRHQEQIGSRLDRKSTRLNSSHVAISYAVFCLK